MHMDGLILRSDQGGNVRNDFCVRGVGNVPADIPGQAEHPTPPVGLDLIQIGLEFDPTLYRWQRNQQGLYICKRDREDPNASCTLNVMWISGQVELEKIPICVSTYHSSIRGGRFR